MAEQKAIVEKILAERRSKHVDSGRRQVYQVLSLVNQYSECESALVDASERIEVMGDRSDQASEQLRTRLEDVVLENFRQQKRVATRLEDVLPQVQLPFLASRVDNVIRFLEVLPDTLTTKIPGYNELLSDIAAAQNGTGSATENLLGLADAEELLAETKSED